MQTKGTCHAASGAEELAPGIVGIVYNRSAGTIQNGYHIALYIGGILITVQRRTYAHMWFIKEYE